MLINDGALHDIDIPTKRKILNDKMGKVEKYMQISKDCRRMKGSLL